MNSQSQTSLSINQNDEETLKNLYREMNQAMVDRDIDTLSRIITSDSSLVHMTGYVQPIQEWFDDVASEEMKYYSWQEENIKDVVINGDTASLTGQSRVRARIWGAGPSTWPLQMKVDFVKENGQWRISNQVASTYR
ncbi:nuclear transport factor 2 family protein [Streptococcus cristatus]|uniref:DUF4440 domain-containing protein n=1 Tax=Streptococcus cristatus TaxID=45634 RepID=A0A139N4N3_STRCR|nr:nuclear transport factor 2 family protein [Streptococcus cristatus]KXT70892.1 hypothetical protein SCRDD08_00326 [Streptococcus cristatus]